MNSYVFFIYEFICYINSYMNSGVPRFQTRMVKINFLIRHAGDPTMSQGPGRCRSQADRASIGMACQAGPSARWRRAEMPFTSAHWQPRQLGLPV